jgi:hypothetical protein
MSVRAKLAAFALALIGSFATGAAVGATVGPIDVADDDPGTEAPASSEHDEEHG